MCQLKVVLFLMLLYGDQMDTALTNSWPHRQNVVSNLSRGFVKTQPGHYR